MSAPDFSHGLAELAGQINFSVAAWHDFGYETPPAPECKAIPPLGERSAEAITAGHAAIAEIDALTRQLSRLREQLVGELRQDSDIHADRVDAMLARHRQERSAEFASCGCPKKGGMIRHQRSSCTDQIVARLDWYAGDEDDAARPDTAPVVCLRAIMTGNGPRQCRRPVDHEPDPACPGNPHARPAPAGDR